MNDLPSTVPNALQILELDELGNDKFRSRYGLSNLRGFTFGGQFLCQALAAAHRTASGWPASSLNGYFLRSGLLKEPLDFTVTRCHDGRRFAVRRIGATQRGRSVFEMTCSFHHGAVDIPGHQFEKCGPVPDPETLLPLKEFAAAHKARIPPDLVGRFGRDFPIELRLVDAEAYFSPAPRREFWFRFPSAATVRSPADQQALVALMSDFWFPTSITASHIGAGKVKGMISVNHSLWFHTQADPSGWLFCRSSSPWANHGRGLAVGHIFDREGHLVATAVQEALLSIG